MALVQSRELAKYGDEFTEPFALNSIDYPADAAFIALYIGCIAIAMYLLRRYISEPLARLLVLKQGHPFRTKAQQAIAIDRFCAAFWKFCSYCGLVAFGVYALKNEQHWVWLPETYPTMFKGKHVPPRIRQYFLIEAAYYVWGSAMLIGGLEPRLKDWRQMLTHHFVTLVLTVSSYYMYANTFTCMLCIHFGNCL